MMFPSTLKRVAYPTVFNAKHILDVLRSTGSTSVVFKFRDSLSPALVLPAEKENIEYISVIMLARM